MHETTIDHTPSGMLARCETCGARDKEFTGYGDALKWCDDHEHKAKYSRLNVGSRPGLKTLEKQFRENSQNLTYTPTEREMWQLLADEMQVELDARATGPIEGQLALFAGDEGEPS